MKRLAIIKQWTLKNFIVRVEALEEDCLDLSFDETGETARQINSGELVAFCVEASVIFLGNTIATDYLGNCIYQSYDEFNDHIECAQMRKQGKNVGSYFSDMVKNVISEAREEIAKMQSVKIRKN